VPGSGAPKTQPLWLQAAYKAFINKAGSNYQIQIGVLFPYERCPDLQDPSSIDMIAAAWLACKPLVDLRGCLETFGEGGWPGRGVIPDGCRSQSGQPHVDPGHPSAA